MTLAERLRTALAAGHSEDPVLLPGDHAELDLSLPGQPAAVLVAVAAFRRLGYDWGAELLVARAELMHQAAIADLDFMETHRSEEEKVEAAVASAVLVEPMLQALHRLAQEEESARRYGFE